MREKRESKDQTQEVSMSVVAHARWTGEPLAEMLHDQFMNLWVRILRG